jgi:hypothetical protein
MQVAGSLSFTEACAIVVPEGADVPLHPAIIAAPTPSVRSTRNNSSRETRKFFTREDLLKFSDSMATVTFRSIGVWRTKLSTLYLCWYSDARMQRTSLQYFSQRLNFFVLYPLLEQQIAEV